MTSTAKDLLSFYKFTVILRHKLKTLKTDKQNCQNNIANRMQIAGYVFKSLNGLILWSRIKTQCLNSFQY